VTVASSRGRPYRIALDLGNTQAKIGLFAADAPLVPIHVWRGDTHDPTSAESLASEIRLALDRSGSCGSWVEGVILGSVVPRRTEAWLATIYAATAAPVTVLEQPFDGGLRVAYSPASDLGADRLANVIALRARFGSSGIAIDLGTATTFDCVTADGEILGGAIVPGIRTSMRGLALAVPSLPEVDLDPAVAVMGRSTEQCLQSGLLHGYASMVEGMVTRLSKQLPGPVQVVATGGLAPLVAPLLGRSIRVEPFLTLQGLHLSYEGARRSACARTAQAPSSPS